MKVSVFLGKRVIFSCLGRLDVHCVVQFKPVLLPVEILSISEFNIYIFALK